MFALRLTNPAFHIHTRLGIAMGYSKKISRISVLDAPAGRLVHLKNSLFSFALFVQTAERIHWSNLVRPQAWYCRLTTLPAPTSLVNAELSTLPRKYIHSSLNLERSKLILTELSVFLLFSFFFSSHDLSREPFHVIAWALDISTHWRLLCSLYLDSKCLKDAFKISIPAVLTP